MQNLIRTLIAIVVLGVLLFLLSLVIHPAAPTRPNTGTEVKPTTVTYQCDGSKSIIAVLHLGDVLPPAEAGGPPRPTGSADVTLSDGRTMTLAQTISADGVRYANAGESVIFWTKGTGAFVMEGATSTYSNCLEAGQ